jgi:hypothetical protein
VLFYSNKNFKLRLKHSLKSILTWVKKSSSILMEKIERKKNRKQKKVKKNFLLKKIKKAAIFFSFDIIEC